MFLQQNLRVMSLETAARTPRRGNSLSLESWAPRHGDEKNISGRRQVDAVVVVDGVSEKFRAPQMFVNRTEMST